MTARVPEPLIAEARAIEAAIALLGTPGSPAGTPLRAELEQRVLRLCASAQRLPAPIAHAFADTLARLVTALDAAAERLRAAGAGAGDSGPAPTDHRRAAAAYGSTAGRRRSGF